MALRLHSTLTGTKDVFEPLHAGHVGMYTCGPTVWNFAHVGNLRAFLFYDLVRRHLQVCGYNVTHVMNLTDIDDRILDQAMHAGTTIAEYVRPYTAAFFEDMAALRAQPTIEVDGRSGFVAGKFDIEFDVVVAGGGSAGCVLATRLTENPAITLCLIEAGGRDRNPWIHIPLGFGKLVPNPKVNWGYERSPSRISTVDA